MHTISAAIAAALLTTACSPGQQTTALPAKAAPLASAQDVSAVAPMARNASPAAAADKTALRVAEINRATFSPAAPRDAHRPAKDDAPQDALIRIQVLLGQARFSPGVDDGRDGSNFTRALAAFRDAHGLKSRGDMDQDTWRALVAGPVGAAPAAQTYTITPEDAARPFAANVGEDLVKLAALPAGPGFTSPLEALAERFHMSQGLLKALNLGVDFALAGTKLAVVDSTAPAFRKGDVGAIEISKADASALAYDKDGKLVASYPATVGSTERPSPSGVHKVNGVAEHAAYVYDPAKMDWGPASHGKLRIKPGPNSPVGVAWIDLNAPGYGIHGTPDPDKIGKTTSHGCVRLTNWDAEALAAGVKPGTKVTFIGERG